MGFYTGQLLQEFGDTTQGTWKEQKLTIKLSELAIMFIMLEAAKLLEKRRLEF